MTIPTTNDKMIDAVMHDLEGNEHKLTDFNDRYVLLSFWSITCFICMKAAGDVRKINEMYGDKLNIISINMDTNKSSWEQGTQRDGISWLNLSDQQGYAGGVGKDYGVVSYPSYVLINTEGVIIDRWMGYKEGRFEEKIGGLFN